ncbi:hypothetical protein [Pyruvatibacter sp.]|uniref:hypothetical protein n=1 Tax=Pyruvatibacter sp. TaxID=1981328 RepID=UPI003263F600
MQEGLQFARWETPFEDQAVELLEVAYTPVTHWPEDLRPPIRDRSIIRLEENDGALTIRLERTVGARGSIIRVQFGWLDAYRVIDEGTLHDMWPAKHAWSDKLGLSTFRVLAMQGHPHHWSGAVHADRWAYFIATQDECVEVITGCKPVVESE